MEGFLVNLLTYCIPFAHTVLGVPYGNMFCIIKVVDKSSGYVFNAGFLPLDCKHVSFYCRMPNIKMVGCEIGCNDHVYGVVILK